MHINLKSWWEEVEQWESRDNRGLVTTLAINGKSSFNDPRGIMRAGFWLGLTTSNLIFKMDLDDWRFRWRVLKFRAKAERGGEAVSSRMIYAGSDDEGRYNLPASTSTIKNQLHFTGRNIPGEIFVIPYWPCHVHDCQMVWLQICELFLFLF
jgi:hypothetical protein